MNRIDTIIFDLGGVLVDWNPRYLYTKVFDSEAEMEFFLTEICNHEWNAEQDGGRTFADAIALLARQYPDFEHHITIYFERWHEMFGPNIEGSIKILDQLVQNPAYKVYALTNWSAETWPIALDLFPFFHWFDGVLVSGQENMKKPDIQIYDRIMEKFGLEKNKCVFFDDSLKNVEGAKEAGIDAFQFLNPEQLKTELINRGIQIE